MNEEKYVVPDAALVERPEEYEFRITLPGVGRIAPTLVGGARLGGGETFVLGTCPERGIDTSDPCAHTVRNWVLLSEDAGGGKVRLLLRYDPIGLMLIVK